jgi:acetyl esterase/lipase
MFVLGHVSCVPRSHVLWLARAGFIVIVPEFRLCPHSNVWEGPVYDLLQLYTWVVSGGLHDALEKDAIRVDVDNIVVFGHSSGGTLAQILVIYFQS